MADLPVPASQQWSVEPTEDVKKMWREMKKQELRSKISRATQDIEDLEKGRIVGLKANIKMWKLELEKLEDKIIDAEI